MKPASAFTLLFLFASLPLYGQSRDMELIRMVRETSIGKLDPSLPERAAGQPFDRYLAAMSRAPIQALHWEVNDCGEGGDGRAAPGCVEARADLAPDTTMSVSILVADLGGKPGSPAFFMAYLKKGSQTTFAKSIRELLQLVGRAQIESTAAVAASPTGITAIALERTPCYGACPVDRIELRADGTANYTGVEHTDRKGQFTGTLQKEEFERLAQWLTSGGFFQLNLSYGDPNADTPTQVIRVDRGGKSKWVVNYAFNRSLQVLAMEKVILSISDMVEWKPAK